MTALSMFSNQWTGDFTAKAKAFAWGYEFAAAKESPDWTEPE